MWDWECRTQIQPVLLCGTESAEHRYNLSCYAMWDWECRTQIQPVLLCCVGLRVQNHRHNKEEDSDVHQHLSQQNPLDPLSSDKEQQGTLETEHASNNHQQMRSVNDAGPRLDTQYENQRSVPHVKSLEPTGKEKARLPEKPRAQRSGVWNKEGGLQLKTSWEAGSGSGCLETSCRPPMLQRGPKAMMRRRRRKRRSLDWVEVASTLSWCLVEIQYMLCWCWADARLRLTRGWL